MIGPDELIGQIGRVVEPPGDDVHSWLGDQAGDLPWLLAHTYTGVVWGKREPAGWELSSQFAGQPALTTATLLELRIFGPPGEVFVWRDGDHLVARALFDGDAAGLDVVEEEQMLWGSAGESLSGPFTRVWDGSQGMEMIVPLRPETDDFTLDVKDEDGRWTEQELSLIHI